MIIDVRVGVVIARRAIITGAGTPVITLSSEQFRINEQPKDAVRRVMHVQSCLCRCWSHTNQSHIRNYPWAFCRRDSRWAGGWWSGARSCGNTTLGGGTN